MGIDDIAETLGMARERGRGCALLVGAGCSVTAGIPAASGVVAYIRDRYPRNYERAGKKTYPVCMAELSRGERRDLIAGYVDNAKVNWAHVCIAELMRRGYVDRILTTNFDPLVIRACALVGLFPAVYDFAASQTFKRGDIAQQAVVYLHGQRSGFVLLNTEEEVGHHAELLKPVFDEAGQGRVWLVVGYSGENDPVFDRLAEFPGFDNKLYWVGYPESEAPGHVHQRLLLEDKDAFYVDGFDADSFFIGLLQKLEAFPPDFIGTPFTYLDQLMETLAPHVPSSGASGPDFTARTREMIRGAIDQYETGEVAETERRAQDLLLAGKLEELERMAPETAMAPDVASSVAWAHVLEGNHLHEQAKASGGAEADDLFTAAYEKYQAALAIKPDMHEALNNWGTALLEQGKTKEGTEADDLFTAAGEKYEATLAIEPDMYEALYNWGNTLFEQGEAKPGADADRLFTAAGEKYEAALAIKPDMHEALYNWGTVLARQAETKEGDEADRLLSAAYEKFEAALAIKPDKHEALNNWGTALLQQAKAKEGDEAARLLGEAERRLVSAEAHAPGHSSYNLACVYARRGDTEEARQWLERSKELGTLPSPEHLATDTDLDGVRDEEWFKELVAAPAVAS